MKTLEEVKSYSIKKMIRMIEREVLDAVILEEDTVFISNDYLNKKVLEELKLAKYNTLETREDGIILSLN